MKKTSPIFRIALGLIGLVTSLALLASSLGLFPDNRTAITANRKQLCESLGVSFSALANHVGEEKLTDTFQNILDRAPDVKSICVLLEDGEILVAAGNHKEYWKESSSRSTDSQISVPIYSSSGLFGTMEMCFQPVQADGIAGYLRSSEFVFVVYLASTGFVAFCIYLGFVLKQLNPKRAIPQRVREALNTLAEGLLILDPNERIVLANDAFQKVTGWDHDSLLGKQVDDLPFRTRDDSQLDSLSHPWKTTLTNGAEVRGQLMGLELPEGQSPTFSVSCSPIVDDKGSNRGAIASFEDVTQLEAKKSELQGMVRQLNKSSAEIKRHNRELAILATRDALTGCHNRRSFFESFDKHWEQASLRQLPLSTIMVDIDHFKSVNDTHGHAVGDDVLRVVGNTLEKSARKHDLVCRYGGEEFAILLPNTTMSDAVNLAEHIRARIEIAELPLLSITASLGVSATSEGATSPAALLEQADKCLYVAKRHGRNQVVRWDDVPTDTEIVSSESPTRESASESDSPISYHAVTALISALAYRDPAAATHSRRVADLCASVAEGLLPQKDCYTLEIAGLLHDIGKIGIPDELLRTHTVLSSLQESTIDDYRKLGADLIDTSFACPHLTEIVSKYRIRYVDSDPYGSAGLPIGARILSIADAFDEMTHHSDHSQLLDESAAFAALRAKAGEDYDPELVERFIYVVQTQTATAEDKTGHVPKDAALSIGLQMERLASALDTRNPKDIAAVARHLHETTLSYGVDGIASKAAEIAQMPEVDSDLFEVVQMANELLDLCRLSQHALIDFDSPHSIAERTTALTQSPLSS